MRGSLVRAAYCMLACLLSSLIIVTSSMPATAAPEVVRRAGKVHSVIEIIKTAYIPSITLNKDYTKDGSFAVTGFGLKSFPDADKISIGIWQREDAGDLHEYEADIREDGSCEVATDIAEYGYHLGRYHLRLSISQGGRDIVLTEREAALHGDNTVYAIPADKERSAVIIRIASPNIDGQPARTVDAVVTGREGGAQGQGTRRSRGERGPRGALYLPRRARQHA